MKTKDTYDYIKELTQKFLILYAQKRFFYGSEEARFMKAEEIVMDAWQVFLGKLAKNTEYQEMWENKEEKKITAELKGIIAYKISEWARSKKDMLKYQLKEFVKVELDDYSNEAGIYIDPNESNEAILDKLNLYLKNKLNEKNLIFIMFHLRGLFEGCANETLLDEWNEMQVKKNKKTIGLKAYEKKLTRIKQKIKDLGGNRRDLAVVILFLINLTGFSQVAQAQTQVPETTPARLSTANEEKLRQLANELEQTLKIKDALFSKLTLGKFSLISFASFFCAFTLISFVPVELGKGSSIRNLDVAKTKPAQTLTHKTLPAPVFSEPVRNKNQKQVASGKTSSTRHSSKKTIRQKTYITTIKTFDDLLVVKNSDLFQAKKLVFPTHQTFIPASILAQTLSGNRFGLFPAFKYHYLDKLKNKPFIQSQEAYQKTKKNYLKAAIKVRGFNKKSKRKNDKKRLSGSKDNRNGSLLAGSLKSSVRLAKERMRRVVRKQKRKAKKRGRKRARLNFRKRALIKKMFNLQKQAFRQTFTVFGVKENNESARLNKTFDAKQLKGILLGFALPNAQNETLHFKLFMSEKGADKKKLLAKATLKANAEDKVQQYLPLETIRGQLKATHFIIEISKKNGRRFRQLGVYKFELGK